MGKKTWYWVLGILAVILIAVLVYSNFFSKGEPPSSANDGHGEMNHTEMGHGQPNSAEDSPLSLYVKEQDKIMSAMMKDMNGIPYSGNAAIDFLSGMVPHHAAAISMAESYLNHGGNHRVLAPLAQDIIEAQAEEITQMESMLTSIQAEGVQDTEQADAYLEAYHKGMNHDMMHTAANSSLDAAFAEGMLMHHQMAVDMATVIQPHTNEEEVLSFARAIVETQNQEIDSMQSVLTELNGAA